MTDSVHERLLMGDWLSWTPDSLIPSAWSHHVPFFAWLFAIRRPQLAVELGTGPGDSFRVLCQISERFTNDGQLVGIDQRPVDPVGNPHDRQSCSPLEDYCHIRHAGKASVIGMDLNEAAAEFSDASVDLVHVARIDSETEIGILDLAIWARKVRPGGVIVITTPSRDPDDAARKAWQQIEEWYPSAVLDLPGLLGVAQIPLEGEVPLIAYLRAYPKGLSSLFRSLGERVEYRYLIGSEPKSGTALRRYISNLMEQHAEDVRRNEEEYRVARGRLEQEVADLSDRLTMRAHEVVALHSEIDMLMAKLATQAAAHERELTQLRQRAVHDVAELEWRRSTELADLTFMHATETATLHAEIAKREEHIQALTRTVSWRMTKPLRVVQSIRMRSIRRSL